MGTDSELGQTLQVPYFYNLAPNRDVTVSPLFTTQAGTVLFGEVRDLQTWGRTIVSGSITNTNEGETSTGSATGEGLRGHLDGTGRYTVDPMTRAGFDGAWTSDKTYLRRYSISNASITEQPCLCSSGSTIATITASTPGPSRACGPPTTRIPFPFALPLAEANLVSDRMRWGSQWTLDSNVLVLTRTGGRDVRRLSNEVGWDVPQVGEWGDLRRYRLSLRGDIYNVEGSVDDPDVGGGGDQIVGARPAARHGGLEPAAGTAVTGALAARADPACQPQHRADRRRQQRVHPQRGQHRLRVRRDQRLSCPAASPAST